MYGIGKCPKHSGNESLPQLRHCRDPIYGVLAVSQKYEKKIKIVDGYVIVSRYNAELGVFFTTILSHKAYIRYIYMCIL